MRLRRTAIIATFCLLFVAQAGLVAYTTWITSADFGPICAGLAIASAIVDVVVCQGIIKRADAFRRACEDEVTAQIQMSLAEYGKRSAHMDRVSVQLAHNADVELKNSQEALERGDLEAFEMHLRNSVDIASRAVVPKCANIMVSALLESAESECAATGVELHTHVTLPMELPVSDEVAGAIFLYLLDKLIKECRALADEGTPLGEAAIVVRSKVSAGQFFVQVVGPCRPNTELRDENGLRYVATIAAEQGGVTSFVQENKTLDLSVMLPVGAQHQRLSPGREPHARGGGA